MLVAIGNLIGRGPHFCAEADRHYTVLYAVIVGRTSKARKGTSEGRVRNVIELIDSEYARRRIKSGLSTGEGLVYEIRDPTGGNKPDPGEPDKRLLAIEPEMASVHQACERQGNTLSATLRRNWDSPALLAPMTKTNRCEATNPHISIIGHITKDELKRLMTDVAMANGWANRFLWCCACRSKCLPEGGRDVDISSVAAKIRTAIEYARTVAEMKRDEGARAIWCDLYAELSEGRPGLHGAVTGRAEAQVMRLACLYALLDHSDQIRPEHLLAALAVWQYCSESARYIFGDSLGDQTADEILRALRASPDGMSRTEIRDHFSKNKSATEIGRALAVLAEYGRAAPEHLDTGGRPAEVWRARAR
jgi:hypothetical protein